WSLDPVHRAEASSSGLRIAPLARCRSRTRCPSNFFCSLPATARRSRRNSENHMWRVGNSRTWRAVLLAWGLTLFCAPADLMAAQLNPSASVDGAGKSDQPFGLSTTMVAIGPLPDKWLGVEREV